MWCKGDLAFFCNCLVTLENLRLWAHERTPDIPRNVDDLETVECADVLGAIAEDQHLTRCAQVCSQVQKRIKPNSAIRERLTKFWEIKDTEQGGDAPKKADREDDLLEQMSLPRSPRIRERTSSILASSFPPSSRRCQTITSKLATSTERNTRANVTCCLASTRLYQCRKDFSMSGMRQRKAETSNTRSITTWTPYTKWESMCSRSSIQLVCASQSWMLFGWEQTYDQAWIVNESESLGSRRHMHAYELSYMAGYVGLVGLSLFAAMEEHTIEAIWFDSCRERCSDCPFGSARANRKSGTTRCHAQEDYVESTRTPQAENRWT